MVAFSRVRSLSERPPPAHCLLVSMILLFPPLFAHGVLGMVLFSPFYFSLFFSPVLFSLFLFSLFLFSLFPFLSFPFLSFSFSSFFPSPFPFSLFLFSLFLLSLFLFSFSPLSRVGGFRVRRASVTQYRRRALEALEARVLAGVGTVVVKADNVATSEGTRHSWSLPILPRA